MVVGGVTTDTVAFGPSGAVVDRGGAVVGGTVVSGTTGGVTVVGDGATDVGGVDVPTGSSVVVVAGRMLGATAVSGLDDPSPSSGSWQ